MIEFRVRVAQEYLRSSGFTPHGSGFTINIQSQPVQCNFDVDAAAPSPKRQVVIKRPAASIPGTFAWSEWLLYTGPAQGRNRAGTGGQNRAGTGPEQGRNRAETKPEQNQTFIFYLKAVLEAAGLVPIRHY